MCSDFFNLYTYKTFGLIYIYIYKNALQQQTKGPDKSRSLNFGLGFQIQLWIMNLGVRGGPGPPKPYSGGVRGVPDQRKKFQARKKGCTPPELLHSTPCIRADCKQKMHCYFGEVSPRVALMLARKNGYRLRPPWRSPDSKKVFWGAGGWGVPSPRKNILGLRHRGVPAPPKLFVGGNEGSPTPKNSLSRVGGSETPPKRFWGVRGGGWSRPPEELVFLVYGRGVPDPPEKQFLGGVPLFQKK